MKRLFVITFLIVLACSVFSQEVIRDTLRSNNLYHKRFDVTHLTVLGKIDAGTFKFMRDRLLNLTYLDLSQVKIVSYEGKEGTNSNIITSYNRQEGTTKILYMYRAESSNSIVSADFLKYKDNEIPNSAFQSHKNLKEVILPQSLVSIGYAAFADCINLSSIKIPQKTSIIVNGEAFFNCHSLTEISNSYNIDSIGESAFNSCRSLRSFTISNNVSQIGRYTFRNCASLQSIIIPKSVRSIKVGAFAGCSELTAIHIHENLTHIGFEQIYEARYSKGVFEECSKLTSFSVAKNNPVFSEINGILYNKEQTKLIYCPESIEGEFTIPPSVREIASFAFRNSNINSVIFSENIQKIGRETFYNCRRLTTVELSDSLKEIGTAAFSCSTIQTIELPKGIKEIEVSTFQQCGRLKSIVIPESVSKIGDAAFWSSGLKTISVYWQDPEPIIVFAPLFYDYTNGRSYIRECILEIPFGTRDKYLAHPVWQNLQIEERKREKNK